MSGITSKVIVSDGQSLIDLAIQETGSLEGLFGLAELNGLQLAQTLTAGAFIQTATNLIINPEQVKYFTNQKVKVNTGFTLPLVNEPDPEPSGSIWVDENGNYISDGNGNYILTNL